MTDLPAASSPHTDPEWVEAFVVELRILEVSGRSIGAALAEVTSHCAESGESAQEAFGDPAAYARALDLPSDSTSTPRPLAIVVTCGGFGGFLLALMASEGWRAGAVGFTAGHLVSGGALVALAAALALRPAASRRAVLRRPVAAPAATVAVAVAISVTATALWDTPLTSADWRLVLAVGLLLVSVQTGYALTDPDTSDVIRHPTARESSARESSAREPAGAGSTGAGSSGADSSGAEAPTRSERALSLLEPWLLALATAIVCVPNFL